ncbi:MAG: type I methionyl aminopeptidase [Clostridiales Family XIII bacterium]|jgi:methionyl aminopeptidase|nr:type I methionyl aminopeptidase [Clostridiales Family XIII bacterium]
MIKLKSKKEIELMRTAGQVTGAVLYELKDIVKPGVSTKEINDYIEDRVRGEGMYPTFLGYQDFPASACISVNDEVVHGIPSLKTILRDGDIVSIDMGSTYQGWVSDAARTFAVGLISDEAQRLIDVTRQSFYEAVKVCRKGFKLGDIGNAVQTYVEAHGYSVVRDLVGHGVGKEMHEDPKVPNYGKAGKGPKLLPGMVLAIEPMVNVGHHDVIWPEHDEDWVFFTSDGSLSAHYENTVVITDDEPIIITIDDRDKDRG